MLATTETNHKKTKLESNAIFFSTDLLLVVHTSAAVVSLALRQMKLVCRVYDENVSSKAVAAAHHTRCYVEGAATYEKFITSNKACRQRAFFKWMRSMALYCIELWWWCMLVCLHVLLIVFTIFAIASECKLWKIVAVL